MNRILLSGMLLGFLAVSANASAPDFTDIDADKDGFLSQTEAFAVGISEQLFAKFDLDRDQQLNPEEYNLLIIGQS